MKWDRSQVLNTLPMLLATTLAVLAVWRYGQAADALPAVLGIIAGYLVDQDHRLTGRLVNVTLTLLAFAFSSLAVQWSLPHGLLFAAVMTALTFSFTLLGAAGSRYRTIAFGTLAVATYTSLIHLPGQAWWLSTALILVGTLLYSMMVLLIHSLFPYRVAEEQLAGSFDVLGSYMETKAQFFDPDALENLGGLQVTFAMQNRAVTEQFNRCRRALAYRLSRRTPRERIRRLTRQYFILQDIHERISSVHLDYRQLGERWEHTDLLFRIERLIEMQAQYCQRAAASLLRGASLTDVEARLDHAEKRLQEAASRLLGGEDEAQSRPLRRLLSNLEAIDEQLRRLPSDQHTDMQLQIAASEDETLRAALHNLRQNLGLHSAVFRHAVRLAVVVAVSCLIVQTLHLELGYWILLTGLFVCQPSYAATRRKIAQRILGTLLGVVVGSVMPLLFPTELGRLVVVVLTTTLFSIFNPRQYSFSTFFITVEALMALSLVGFDVAHAVVPRLIDTLAGSALAWLAVNFMWPDWKWLNLRQRVQSALRATAAYLQAIVQQYGQGRTDDVSYRLLRRQAYERAAEVGDSVNEMEFSEQYDRAQARQGPQLLALTYELLGQVSALGAARTQLPPAARSALPPPLPSLAQRISELIAELPELPRAEAEAQLQQLSREVNTLPAPAGRAELTAFRQQLRLITELLRNFAATLDQPGERRG